MRKFIAIFIITLASCGPQTEVPENLISQEKMTTILTDLILYQQSNYAAHAEIGPLDFGKINTVLITNQNVSISDFETSYKYYINTPDLYNEILIDIRTELESRLPDEDRIKREKLRAETK